tara:strand:- start:3521 stop:3670 length:150 start_codon:yes stop_codon:yes gene_type:complete
MNEKQISGTELKKEIIEQFDYLSPIELIKIFEMIFGHGEVKLDEVDWSK